MSLGPEIKDVLEQIGTSYMILRPNSGELGTEYLDYEMNRQVTKPFIREYFLEFSVPYDSVVIGGDIIRFSDLRCYLVMNKTPENFEDECLGYEGVLYKCNVSGELLRPSGEVWGSPSYRRPTVWTSAKLPAYGLITEKMFGTDLIQDEELGQIGIEAHVLYLPTSYGAQPLDRYWAASGEYYKIEVVESRKFDGVDVCHLSEDSRE